MPRPAPGVVSGGSYGGRMDSHGQYEQQVVWAVVGTGIGPLLLAATREGLVNVVFHADEAVREKALGRLADRLGAEPVESPDSPLLSEAIGQVRAYFMRRAARFRPAPGLVADLRLQPSGPA